MLDRRPAAVDIAVSLALIAIAAAFLYDARDLPPGMFEPVGPGPIPSAVAWCVVALAVYVIVQAAVRLATGMLPEREPPAFETRGVDAAIVSALLVAYVAAMGLGFVRFAIATSAFILAAVWILAGRQVRVLPAAAGIAVVMGFGLDYVFTRILVTDLP